MSVAADSGDTLYRCSGDDIDIKARINYLLGVLYAVESTPGYCRVKQPSHDYYMEFIEAALMTPLAVTCSATSADAVRTLQFPDKFNDLRGRPFHLFGGEKINVWSNNASDEDTLIALFIGDGKITTAMLEAVVPTAVLRGTVDQTLTANTWTAGSVTWSQDLKRGTYAIIGMKVGAYISGMATFGAVARLTGLDSTWRPGVPVVPAEGDKIDIYYGMRDVPFCKWPLMSGISFPHNNPPDIELASPYALTDFAVELMLQQIG